VTLVWLGLVPKVFSGEMGKHFISVAINRKVQKGWIFGEGAVNP
jgi:hypothetical protein